MHVPVIWRTWPRRLSVNQIVIKRSETPTRLLFPAINLESLFRYYQYDELSYKTSIVDVTYISQEEFTEKGVVTIIWH